LPERSQLSLLTSILLHHKHEQDEANDEYHGHPQGSGPDYGCSPGDSNMHGYKGRGGYAYHQQKQPQQTPVQVGFISDEDQGELFFFLPSSLIFCKYLATINEFCLCAVRMAAQGMSQSQSVVEFLQDKPKRSFAENTFFVLCSSFGSAWSGKFLDMPGTTVSVFGFSLFGNSCICCCCVLPLVAHPEMCTVVQMQVP
jgi:hypothetical protein